MRRSPRSELARHSLLIPLVAVTVSALCPVADAQTPRSVWDGVYTAAQAKQGEALYKENCSSCHGETLNGEDAPALAGSEFLSNWGGLTVGDLFERIRTTMPQNKAGSLSREQNAAIVAFIFSACQFPAGKSALPQETEVLKQIRIDASKPEKK